MSMMQLSPATLEPSPHDGPSSGASSGATTPEAPFAAILHDERARSATGKSREGGRAHAQSDRSDVNDDASDAAAATVDPTAVAVPTPVPAPADQTTVVQAALAAALADPADAAAPGVGAGTATPATTAVTPGNAVPAAIPGAATTAPASASTTLVSSNVAAHPASPGAPSPAAGTLGETIATPAGSDTNPQSVAPRATPVHDGTPSDILPDGPQGEASNVAVSAPAAAGIVGAKTADAASSTSASDPAPQTAAPTTVAPAGAAPVQPQPLDATASASATLPSHAVGLDRAVETVRLALRAAADRGVTHARISLNPRELGGIEIHLRHTAEGLVARVVAEHGGAAQLLQHAGAELRRSLEAQGVTLLQLDIGASGQQDGRPAGEQRGFGESGARGDAAGDPATTDDGAAGDAAANAPASTLSLSNGVLVDVLA